MLNVTNLEKSVHLLNESWTTPLQITTKIIADNNLIINKTDSILYKLVVNNTTTTTTTTTPTTTNVLQTTSKNNIEAILDPILALDKNAKEIILLSTAFVTMMLSTCFLLFIIWFCCYIACKDRNNKLKVKRIKKSINETETNLNEAGMVDNQPSSEYFTLKTMQIKKHNFRADTIIYSHDHDYDILGDSIKNKKPNKITSQKKENLKEKLGKPDENPKVIKVEQINQAYEPEPDLSSNINRLDLPRLTPSQIEKEYYEYRLKCGKRDLGSILTSTSDNSSSTLRSSGDTYIESIAVSPKTKEKRHSGGGIYTHNIRLKNKNRISSIKTSFNNNRKNVSSKIKISKTKPNNHEKDEKVWQI